MKHLTRMSIHSIDAASAQPLSRDRMRAIKGGAVTAMFTARMGVQQLW